MSTQAVPEIDLSVRQPAERTEKSLGTTRPALRALPKIRSHHRGLTAGVIALMAVALAVVLAVNIHVANTQYRVVELTTDHQLITQQNQALDQQLHHLQSPQVLSNSAVSHGMVMPAQSGAVALGTGEVEGAAEVADSSDRPSSFVATPVRPGEETAPALDVAEQAAVSPSGLLGSGALNTLTEPLAGQNGESGDALAADGAPEVSSRELNGGTIPAPGLD